MKTFTIYTAMAIFGALAHAVPLQAESRQTHEVELTFRGAPPDVAFFKQSFPTNGALTRIDNPLSVSKIESGGDASCTCYGIDGSVTYLWYKGQTVDVGPPQTQIYCSCYA